MDIVTELRARANKAAANRRVAEFGPAGGNPSARPTDHLEWRAADRIEELEAVCWALLNWSTTDLEASGGGFGTLAEDIVPMAAKALGEEE